MSRGTESGPAALRRAVAARLAGTAAMKAAQTISYRATGSEGSTTPAEVGKGTVWEMDPASAQPQRCVTVGTHDHGTPGST
jgi:hypothetical protein